MGVRLDIDDMVVVVTVVDVSGNEGASGNDICFFARGGGGGKRSELDETFERVSSLDVLLL